jgi:hypothetical protein
MRKSFDSLHWLVREHLELDTFAGHPFAFASRRKDRVKTILYWDRNGFAVWNKRAEERRYAVPFGDGRRRDDHGAGIRSTTERHRSEHSETEKGTGGRAIETFLFHVVVIWKRTSFV